MTRLLRLAFQHRADLLAALVYLCLAYLSFNALADYANGHGLFPQPYGGWAFAVAVDGSVLYAFISFKRAPWMAGVLLLVGATTTYLLQRWHAEQAPHPLIVAGVVPGLMVLVTLAWHLIRELADDPAPQPAQPVPPVPGSRPEPRRPAATPAPSRRGPITLDRDQVAAWLAEDRSQRWIADQLGLTNRQRTQDLARLVRDLRNGDRPKEPVP
jgi:hypothetical protein